MSDNTKPLKVIPQYEAVKQANEKIKEFREEEHPGLRSRWKALDKVMGGFWRFHNLVYLAGASGSGKSFILNMLREDFASPLNEGYPYPIKILSFSFEMSAADEVIRTYSSRLKSSYSELVSAAKKLSKEKFEQVQSESKRVSNDTIYYVESAGNKNQIYETVKKFQQRFPKHKLVITLDHTLLMQYLDEKGEIELVTSLSRLSMQLKKEFGAVIILLGQLNDKIEDPERIANSYLHYPKKRDIHGSKSVFMASDAVFAINKPEDLHITKYGPHEYPTQGLIAFHVLKNRLFGTKGLIRMRENFEKGTLIHPYENKN